eukprot:430954-Prorocentrum_minimum.AAC.1
MHFGRGFAGGGSGPTADASRGHRPDHAISILGHQHLLPLYEEYGESMASQSVGRRTRASTRKPSPE